MSKHTPYSEDPHSAGMGGVHRRYKFDNGYHASVVKFSMSYGGSQDLWELAVTDENGCLDYTTPITDDVIGYLSDSELDDVLDRIAALPAKVASA